MRDAMWRCATKAETARYEDGGLIGGMSWESPAEYYRILNQGVRDRLGPTASARWLS